MAQTAAAASATATRRGLQGWSGVLVEAVVGSLLFLVVVPPIIGEIPPPFIPAAVLLLAGVVWFVRSTGRAVFGATTLSASAGTVGVAFRSADNFSHTFTIPDLNVNLVVNGGQTGRVTFDAAPGTYEFLCVVPFHDATKGTLEVT